MRTRLASTLAVAALAASALSGCTFNAEIANLQPYDPSDGVGADLEDLGVRNAMLITSDGSEANLVMTVVNKTGGDVDLLIQYGPTGDRQTEVIAIPAFPELSQVGSDTENQVLLSDEEIIAGALFPVYFQFGDVQGEVIEIPVLDGTLPEYELLVP